MIIQFAGSESREKSRIVGVRQGMAWRAVSALSAWGTVAGLRARGVS